MLRKKTLLILGAGAGFDFGMPLGRDLAAHIARKVDIRFEGGHKMTSGDWLIMESLGQVARQKNENVNDYLHAGRLVRNGIDFTRSIDSFLHKHENEPKLQFCAKLAIARVIGEQERSSSLYVDESKASSVFSRDDEVKASWLSRLFYVLQEGVSRSQLDLLLRNFMVINFNYDRCLEHFMLHTIKRTYGASEAETTNILKANLRIVHPYGLIGELPWKLSDGMKYGGEGDEYLHYTQLLQMASGIQTFNEEMHNNEIASLVRGMISEAECICILGYHFHEPNMRLLSEAKRTANPHIYATVYKRSDGAVTLIRQSIAHTFGISDGMITTKDVDCVGFFDEFEDLLGS
jgi:hypothetical protein